MVERYSLDLSPTVSERTSTYSDGLSHITETQTRNYYIEKFGRKFHQLSPYRETEFDLDHVIEMIGRMEDNPNAFVFVTDKGLIGGVLVQNWFSPTEVAATELFWYSEEKGHGRKLRELFEAWARQSGAQVIHFTCLINEHEKRVRHNLSQIGYKPVEIGFRKRLV